MAWLDFLRKKKQVIPNDRDRIKDIAFMQKTMKVFIDSRTKQRVVITSLSYTTMNQSEFTVVIQPVCFIGQKDRSFMYEESGDIRYTRTNRFNEYFDKDPRIIYDNIDFLKPIR